jgi:leucyl aminopeptidase
MKIEFVASASASQVLAVLVNEGRAFVGAGSQLDAATSGALTRAMTASRFTGGSNSTLVVAAPAGVDASTVVLTGAGDPGSV